MKYVVNWIPLRIRVRSRNTQPHLKRTRILSGIQFTTYFIEIFVLETKQFVGSFVHVILMPQTCGSAQATLREANAER